jgi:hypothetical protein
MACRLGRLAPGLVGLGLAPRRMVGMARLGLAAGDVVGLAWRLERRASGRVCGARGVRGAPASGTAGNRHTACPMHLHLHDDQLTL